LKSDGFKDDLGSLLDAGGMRMFKQGTNTDVANKYDLQRQQIDEKLAKLAPSASFEDRFFKRSPSVSAAGAIDK
ncbi:MAG: hypothetical protein LH472_10115, partial [Pyrinomonadaceae bacterium]|nr:hypothetical protein [Pyrinomonadaceae bacterium]